MDYFSLMERRLADEEEFLPIYLDSKDHTRQFADLVGVRTSSLFAIGSIEDVLDSPLPKSFVLKPAFASTSIGVRLLERKEDKWEDIVSRDVFSTEQLIEEAHDVSARYPDSPINDVFIAEELLVGIDGSVPPADIRFYCFQGEIGLILMERHLQSPVEAMYFDGDFMPFPDLASRYGIAPGMSHLESIVESQVPENWQELLNVAKRISTAVATAFCRVDLYNTVNGVYLGEITLTPGTFYYKNRKIMSNAEAVRLGRMWQDAEKRLAGSYAIKDPNQLRGLDF
ncbi:ATP-grasp fold amidoligase family protein [uncultured Actinomyces sp.]|uniref:ATP-grasp fold amidoligase family protein n=1 Tax=uncultured Actinomyces sp. TaxID=249061 RepID=UPI002602AF78|nr:ATP-grasp fold amidoligase family protein [uncultured Actinomyces sp.]